MATVAQTLIDLHIDSLKAFDREIAGLIERSAVAPGAAATLPRCDYEATRQYLLDQVPASLRPTFKPLPSVESTDIYFPMTTATGTYRAQGTITINKDLAQGLLKAGETPMFKVGDRVKILRAFTEEEKRKPPHWTSSMDALVGAEGVVDYIGEFVSVKVGKGSYSWLPQTLELVPTADEIPFGPFPSFEEIEAVRLGLNYRNPVWEVKSPTGKLSLVRCYPNIGDVDTFASFRDTMYTKSEKFPAFANYTARLLDKDGKPTERKHIALTTGVAVTQPDTITMHVNGKTATFPATATAAQAVEAMKAAGINNVSVGDAAPSVQAIIGPSTGTVPDKHGTFFSPSSDAPVYMHKVTVQSAKSQSEKIADALRQLPIGRDAGSSNAAAKTHSDIVAAKTKQRESAQAVNPHVTIMPVREYVTFTAPSQPASKIVKVMLGQSDVAYTTATGPRDPQVQDVTLVCKSIPAKEGFAASQIHHEVTYARGVSGEPLGKVGEPLGKALQRVDTLIADDFEVDSQGESPLKHESFGAQLAAMSHRLAAEAAAKEALTSATTSATIPKQGATMPPSDTAKPSRLRRAITEATRRAPVELGLNQAHAAIVKQAARKFKGTRAEKAVVARFLSDLLGSEYGKAGLAAALATVIPQLAPLLGKHEGKAETLAEELATRSATILAVKAGSDLISLLGPLTAILSDMISSAETPQITAGTGRSALDEIGDVATVRSV